MTESTNMKSETPAKQEPRATFSENHKILLKEIGAKWNKFSEQDVSALKSRDDLVTQIAAKYNIDRSQAQRDADSLLKGRTFSTQ